MIMPTKKGRGLTIIPEAAMSAVPEHDMYVNTHRHGLRLRLKLRLRLRLRLRAGAKA